MFPRTAQNNLGKQLIVYRDRNLGAIIREFQIIKIIVRETFRQRKIIIFTADGQPILTVNLNADAECVFLREDENSGAANCSRTVLSAVLCIPVDLKVVKILLLIRVSGIYHGHFTGSNPSNEETDIIKHGLANIQ